MVDKYSQYSLVSTQLLLKLNKYLLRKWDAIRKEKFNNPRISFRFYEKIYRNFYTYLNIPNNQIQINAFSRP